MNKKHWVLVIFLCSFVLCVQAFMPVTAHAKTVQHFYEEAYGTSTKFLLYNVHMAICMADDAFRNNVYTVEETKRIIKEQKAIISIVTDQVNQLLYVSDDNVKKPLEGIKKCLSELDNLAVRFETYFNDRSGLNSEALGVARESSYKCVAKLLKLKDKVCFRGIKEFGNNIGLRE